MQGYKDTWDSSGQETENHNTCQNTFCSIESEADSCCPKQDSILFTAHLSLCPPHPPSLSPPCNNVRLAVCLPLPSSLMMMMPAAPRQCWQRERREEGRRKGRKGGSGEQGKDGREGGRKERRGGEGEKRERGASRCSSNCGPGGELPSPGYSAETSMGGCVGSHHDSSGSLNENSDGTGGNFRGILAPLDAYKVGFLEEGASYELSVCCPGWRSSPLPLFPSQTEPETDPPQPPSPVSPSSQRALKRDDSSATLQTDKYSVCDAASLCSLVLTELAG